MEVNQTAPAPVTVAMERASAQSPVVIGTDLVEIKEQARTRRIQTNKLAILAAMKAAGIKVVTVEYTGEGDSGNGMDVSAEGGSELETNTQVDLMVVSNSWNEGAKCWDSQEVVETMSLADALEKFVDDLIEKHHSGFENGDGGGGSVTLDAKEGTVAYEKYDCYVERSSEDIDV
jgi:hypothetical protein